MTTRCWPSRCALTDAHRSNPISPGDDDNPTVLARLADGELEALLTGYGHRPYVVEGDEPAVMHKTMAAVLDEILDEIARIQHDARAGGVTERPCWPVLVLRTPKGWTGPAEVNGLPVEGTWRAHQVPLADVRHNPAHLAALEEWMRSYRPEELFDAEGRPRSEVLALSPEGPRPMGANPHTNGGTASWSSPTGACGAATW